MTTVADLDREIVILRNMLEKLKSKRETQMKVASLQIEIQKAKMEARLPELLATPFVIELRALLIKAAENQFVSSFREAMLEAVKEKPRSKPANPMVI